MRHRVGVSYALNEQVRLVASHEIVDGSSYTAQTTHVGAEVQPWKGAHLTGGMNDQMVSEYGPRTFGQFGLSQSITLSKTWSVDAAVDSSTTLSGKTPTAQQINPNQPLGSGAHDLFNRQPDRRARRCGGG